MEIISLKSGDTSDQTPARSTSDFVDPQTQSDTPAESGLNIATSPAACSSSARHAPTEPGLSIITNLKPAVKSDRRVNVFLDDKFAFSLDLAQVTDYKLKIGKTLTTAEVKKLEKASNFGKLYQRTLEWALTRPRSIRETRDYLKKKQFQKPEYGITAEDIEAVLQKLIEKNYLNDFNFAKYYLENRFQKKGISKKRLALELQKKGINAEIIEQAFAESPRDEAAEVQKIIAKKRRRYTDDQLLAYLIRQGFSYDLASECLKRH